MIRHEIDVSLDYVIAFGQRVDRPDRVSRADWDAFWRRAATISEEIKREYQ